MVPESSSRIMSFSGDDFEFDIDFEFDAPRFYDFSRPELYSETEEIEIWFQSSGNYPPSPFSPKFNWKFEPFKQITNTISESKPVEIIESSEAETGLNCKDKFNGFIYYNQTVKDVSKKKSKSKTKTSNSTLTRPTASLLARQNKPLDIYSVQLLTRCQRSLAKFGENVSPILVSKLQNQDINRQKQEAKVAHVSSRAKLTVPKEPNLRTAERSERHSFRSKVNTQREQIATSSSKRHIRNKNINLEPVSTSLAKTNTPRSQHFQAKTDVVQENDATKSRTLPIDSLKTRIVKENHSRKINCQVYESKSSPLDPKISSKEDLVEAIRIEYGNQSSCRTDINRSLDLCRKFDSQEVARNLITA
ncbi:putative TPX2 central domain-containing protein [Arabidopsis thaliana]